MQDHKTRLARLLRELDCLAKFDQSGKTVTFDANAYENMLARADNLDVMDSRKPFPILDLPIV
jgi:hypothetical protein